LSGLAHETGGILDLDVVPADSLDPACDARRGATAAAGRYGTRLMVTVGLDDSSEACIEEVE
jgi:hypothetical protein